ncbi:hypothetical protein BYT27DRAFT_7255380 [Phlegmacium glaucopus]|nr:hypothetical protein BYT27DRAFT_7255380 [Phlegmacium glaucopus]
MSQLPSSLASVEHLVFNPVVSPGNLSPRIIYDFEQFCQDFFANAKTPLPDDKKVIRILPCFQDPLVRDWIASHRACLSALSFSEFITELHSEFLPRDWEDKICGQILNSRLDPYKLFSTWANALLALNCTLRNTNSHLSKQRLREQIEANVDEELRILGREANTFSTTTLREMFYTLMLCDEKRKLSAK